MCWQCNTKRDDAHHTVVMLSRAINGVWGVRWRRLDAYERRMGCPQTSRCSDSSISMMKVLDECFTGTYTNSRYVNIFFVVIGFGFIYRERRVEWDSMWWHWCEREEKEYDMATIRLYRSRRMKQSRLLLEAFRIMLGLILWDRSCFIRITEHRVRQNSLFTMMCYAHTTCSPNIVMKLTRAFFYAWHLSFTRDREISLLWVTNHQS